MLTARIEESEASALVHGIVDAEESCQIFWRVTNEAFISGIVEMLIQNGRVFFHRQYWCENALVRDSLFLMLNTS